MKKSKLNKVKTAERRKKQFDKFMTAYYTVSEKKTSSNDNTPYVKKEVLLAKKETAYEGKFLKKDLIDFFVVNGLLLVALIVVYIADLKTDFLSNLASNLLGDIIK